MFSIRHGQISEVVICMQELPEFTQPYGADVLTQRLKPEDRDADPLILMATNSAGAIMGFKVGYDRDQDGSYYSWLGGVFPPFRRLGVALALAEAQETWAREQGYQLIRFKTRNRHKNMLHFALSRDFNIVDFEAHEEIGESRIWLEREL